MFSMEVRILGEGGTPDSKTGLPLICTDDTDKNSNIKGKPRYSRGHLHAIMRKTPEHSRGRLCYMSMGDCG